MENARGSDVSESSEAHMGQIEQMLAALTESLTQQQLIINTGIILFVSFNPFVRIYIQFSYSFELPHTHTCRWNALNSY